MVLFHIVQILCCSHFTHLYSCHVGIVKDRKLKKVQRWGGFWIRYIHT